MTPFDKFGFDAFDDDEYLSISKKTKTVEKTSIDNRREELFNKFKNKGVSTLQRRRKRNKNCSSQIISQVKHTQYLAISSDSLDSNAYSSGLFSKSFKEGNDLPIIQSTKRRKLNKYPETEKNQEEILCTGTAIKASRLSFSSNEFDQDALKDYFEQNENIKAPIQKATRKTNGKNATTTSTIFSDSDTSLNDNFKTARKILKSCENEYNESHNLPLNEGVRDYKEKETGLPSSENQLEKKSFSASTSTAAKFKDLKEDFDLDKLNDFFSMQESKQDNCSQNSSRPRAKTCNSSNQSINYKKKRNIEDHEENTNSKRDKNRAEASYIFEKTDSLFNYLTCNEERKSDKFNNKNIEWSFSKTAFDEEDSLEATASAFFSEQEAIEKQKLSKFSNIKKAKNPISLSKEQNNFHAGIEFTRKSDHDGDDDLWDSYLEDDPIENDNEKNIERKVHKTSTKSAVNKTAKNISSRASNDSSRLKQKSNPTKNKQYASNRKIIQKRTSYDSLFNCYEACEDEKEESLAQQYMPSFDHPKFHYPDQFQPFYMNEEKTDYIPPSINRYLEEYQRLGVSFLYSRLIQEKGAILGDDMGMGKTIQIIALLSALLNKTGTKKDLAKIQALAHKKEQEYKERQQIFNHNLLHGDVMANELTPESEEIAKWSPVLIVVPPSVIDMWKETLKTWGYFSVSHFVTNEKDEILRRVRVGILEILLCSKSLLRQELKSIRWSLIIVDEYHHFKGALSQRRKTLVDLKETSMCPLIGLTGTAFQNNHKELYYLVSLCQPDLFGEWSEFSEHYAIPLKHARTKDAQKIILEIGKKRQLELIETLKEVYLHRKKEDYLQEYLTQKHLKVLFCELSDLQKKLYQRIIKLRDIDNLRKGNAPCDCGVNRGFFAGFRRMRTKLERSNYLRRNKGKLIVRNKCCYLLPFNDSRTEIDPSAILFRTYHENGEECKNCPHCIQLPAFQKLYKVASHASLVQVDQNPDLLLEGSKDWKKAKADLEFAKVVLTDDILECLPGNSYFRHDNFLNDHESLSGKMKELGACLHKFNRNQDRVLLFSYSTRTLDLIEFYTKRNGFTYSRLDGNTPRSQKQLLVDKFQSDPTIFLFLISTTAGGQGLNLTAANKVIIYDVNWNPAHDEQAQDRAFRIGQKKDVEVIRLVARGCIEEQMFIRQIYKNHLREQALEDDYDEKRLFKGVEGEKTRKGELFGLENLLKFKDGSFLADLDKSIDTKQNYMFDREKFVKLLSDVEEEDFHFDDDQMIALQMQQEELKPHETKTTEDPTRDDEESEFEEDVGGATQVFYEECENVCRNMGDEESEENSTKVRIIDELNFTSKSKINNLILGKSLDMIQKIEIAADFYVPTYLKFQ